MVELQPRPPGSDYYWSVGVSGGRMALSIPEVSRSRRDCRRSALSGDRQTHYNAITFYGAGGVDLGSFNGAQVEEMAPPPPFNLGDQSVTEYFTFSSSAPIYSATYTSTTNAFETANYTYVAAVPEASDFVFFGAGLLGLLGSVVNLRKRKGQASRDSSMLCA